MTTDQQALLNAILATPEDDAPRLIYADWLDENADTPRECCTCDGNGVLLGCAGDKHNPRCDECNGTGRISNGHAERAEFIRVSIDFANADPNWDGEKTYELVSRVKKLNRRVRDDFKLTPDFFKECYHGFDWTNWVDCEDKPHVICRRGFIDEVHCTLAQYLGHCHQIAAQHPVTKWVITDREPANNPITRKARDRDEWWFIFVSSAVEYPSQNALPYELMNLWEQFGIGKITGGNAAYNETKEDSMEALQRFCYFYARTPNKE